MVLMINWFYFFCITYLKLHLANFFFQNFFLNCPLLGVLILLNPIRLLSCSNFRCSCRWSVSKHKQPASNQNVCLVGKQQPLAFLLHLVQEGVVLSRLTILFLLSLHLVLHQPLLDPSSFCLGNFILLYLKLYVRRVGFLCIAPSTPLLLL